MLWSELRRSGAPWQKFGNVEQNIKRMQDEMNRLFSGMTSPVPVQPEFPAVNLWLNDTTAIATTEIAGVSPDNLEISVIGKTLSIKGSRPKAETGEGQSYHRKERWEGEFSRALELPYNVDSDKVEAKFEDGVLYITLPRAEAEKPKKIVIKSA
ncbi:MAG: Hsp20/alpha crystallin family protein [Nitrospirae bacterium]|nr:Hsp20/alpha crystallin family protein [Nitrospirota bacterium]